MSVEPEQILVGSPFPLIGAVERMEIAFNRVAASNGFVPVCDGLRPGASFYTFACKETVGSVKDGCTFRAVLRFDRALGVYVVTHVTRTHNHPFRPSRDDRLSVQKDTDGTIADAQKYLRIKVGWELHKIATRTLRSYGDVPSGVLQARIIRGLIPAFGLAAARDLEASARTKGLLTADYPTSQVSALPAPTATPSPAPNALPFHQDASPAAAYPSPPGPPSSRSSPSPEIASPTTLSSAGPPSAAATLHVVHQLPFLAAVNVAPAATPIAGASAVPAQLGDIAPNVAYFRERCEWPDPKEFELMCARDEQQHALARLGTNDSRTATFACTLSGCNFVAVLVFHSRLERWIIDAASSTIVECTHKNVADEERAASAGSRAVGDSEQDDQQGKHARSRSQNASPSESKKRRTGSRTSSVIMPILNDEDSEPEITSAAPAKSNLSTFLRSVDPHYGSAFEKDARPCLNAAGVSKLAHIKFWLGQGQDGVECLVEELKGTGAKGVLVRAFEKALLKHIKDEEVKKEAEE
ncbi:hypothetical protein JCM6882_000438 [Rhodosporidiobolus microsporus]